MTISFSQADQFVAGVLTNDGSGNLSWETPGGGGLTGFTTFGSSPNADGGSASGSNIVLQPADATHPGGVSTGAQTFGGNKTFDGGTFMSDLGSGWPGLAVGASVGGAQGAIGYYVGGNNLTVHSGSDMLFYISNANIVTLKSTTFDMTGLGVGGSIKLKSPDGTVYTLTIANGGTVHIV